METIISSSLQTFLRATFILLALAITPEALIAEVITIRVSQAAWNTGTVFSDYTGWGSTTTYIRTGQTSSYNGRVSGGWARFDISAIPDGSQINSIRFYNTVYDYDGVGPAVDLVQMSHDPLTAGFQTIWNDLYDGSTYFNNAWLNQRTTFYFDMPSSARQDIQNRLSSNWFAVGFKYDDVSGYFAYIGGWDQTDRPYIVVDYTPPGDSFEPDNTSSQAKQQALNSTSADHSIVPANDIDWIYFVLNSNMNVVIEADGVSGGDTRMWLYNSSLSQLAFDDDGGNGNYSKISASRLSAGTYYVKIDEYGNDNTISAYRIMLTATSSIPTQTYVHGRMQYNDRNNNPKPTRYALVQIIDGNNFLGDRVLANTYTDGSGNYGATVTNDESNGLDIIVKVYSEGVSGAYPGSNSWITAVKDNIFVTPWFLQSTTREDNEQSDLTISLTESNEGGGILCL